MASTISRLPEPIRLYLRDIRDKFREWGNRLGAPVEWQYPRWWYESMAEDESFGADHRHTAAVIADVFDPESVIDFGCGVGHTLAGFHERGIDIQGVEGAKTVLDVAVVPTEALTIADLRDPIRLDPADIAVCIEVAEHLPPASANTLVDTLVGHAPVVVFTAATPGQGGTNHHNEQPREYWIKRFDERGYRYQDGVTDTLTQRIEPEISKTDWIPQNLMVFESRSQ